MFGAILKATNSSFHKGKMYVILSQHISEESYEATCIHM